MPPSSSSGLRTAAAPRLSQRRPLACRDCTRRKVKCDKKAPCSRCLRLVIECTRELVLVRKQISRHGDEIEFLRKLKQQLENGDGSPSVIGDIERRISLLEGGNVTEDGEQDASTQQDILEDPNAKVSRVESALPAVTKQHKSNDEKANDATMVTVLEYLAWSSHYGTCYPHRTCTCHTRRSHSEMISISSIPMKHGRAEESLLKDWSILPSIEDATKVINFHATHLAWHHNSMHIPTFTEQYESFWRLGTCDHPLWMALYLSVLSSSVWCSQNSRKFQSALGLLYSVQAIAISTEVTHNLGLSNLNATLSSAGVRIAQCLGLHNVSDTPSPGLDSTEKWHETIEREVGKRVWCQIVIQDHFAIPFTDSYCINPSHFSTSLPSNCDDHGMEERDDNTPTISSYTRTLGRMASLIPPLLDNLGPLRSRNPSYEQYQRVIKMDYWMRELVGNIPPFLLRRNPNEPAWIPWLGIARRSLAITAADKIIMIHRPFLFQSFQSPQYAYTRNTCVSAAITILREHERITIADDVSIWTHSAFCVTAAMVLGLELLYPRQDNTEKTQNYWDLVIAAKERLAHRQGDVMADRGVRLIDTILQESGREGKAAVSNEVDVQPTVDFRKILARFLSLDDSLSSNADALGENQPKDVDFDFPFPINDDFDVWLNQVFGYDQI